MSFERWVMRLAEGYYSSYGRAEDPFPHTDGKWGCLFLLRTAQAVEYRDSIRRASKIHPGMFLWHFQHGLASLVWDVSHTLVARKAAVAGASHIQELADAAAKAARAIMFWDTVVSLRVLRAEPGDEEELVAAIRTAIEVNLQSSSRHIREGAEYGLWHLEQRT